MPTKPTTNDVTKQNKETLFNLASSPELWEGYLDVMAQHTGRDRRRTVDGTYASLDNLSALNCAAVAFALEGQDTREVMTAREWASVFPEAHPADEAAGVPIVKASSTGKNVWVDLAYPASAMEGLPERRYHNLPGKIDLDDDVDRQCWATAVGSGLSVWRDRVGEDGKRVYDDGKPARDKVPVAFDELDPNVAYVVRAHFGVQASSDAPAPSSPVIDDVASTLDEVKAYCDQVKADAQALTGQITKSIKETRREIMGIERDEPAPTRDAAPVAQATMSAARPATTLATDQPAPSVAAEPYSPIGRTPAENARAATVSATRAQDAPAAAQGMSPQF